MNTDILINTQIKLERITRQWWFFLILFSLFFTNPYTSTGIDQREIPKLIPKLLASSEK